MYNINCYYGTEYKSICSKEKTLKIKMEIN